MAGDPQAPAIVSEVDLFLRLCPAPTIGVTGTKGKTTTTALIQHLLAADPSHRAVLGGNIGRPLVERLFELRPDDQSSKKPVATSATAIPSIEIRLPLRAVCGWLRNFRPRMKQIPVTRYAASIAIWLALTASAGISVSFRRVVSASRAA